MNTELLSLMSDYLKSIGAPEAPPAVSGEGTQGNTLEDYLLSILPARPGVSPEAPNLELDAIKRAMAGHLAQFDAITPPLNTAQSGPAISPDLTPYQRGPKAGIVPLYAPAQAAAIDASNQMYGTPIPGSPTGVNKVGQLMELVGQMRGLPPHIAEALISRLTGLDPQQATLNRQKEILRYGHELNEPLKRDQLSETQRAHKQVEEIRRSEAQTRRLGIMDRLERAIQALSFSQNPEDINRATVFKQILLKMQMEALRDDMAGLGLGPPSGGTSMSRPGSMLPPGVTVRPIPKKAP